MVKRIKVRRVDTVRGTLSKKKLKVYDITKTVAQPIIDIERSDAVLDTSQMTLYNKDKDPLKPFTKIIITLTEDIDDGEEDTYIYRFVESDNVIRVATGEIPIYKHIVSLIEPTKVLEREPVDNLTFTNYLDENYDFIVPYSLNAKVLDDKYQFLSRFCFPKIEEPYYGTGNRFIGQYHLIGDEINPVIAMNIGVSYYPDAYYVDNIVLHKGQKHSALLRMTDYYVELPNGQIEKLGGLSSGLTSVEFYKSKFTFTELGSYKFKQTYVYARDMNGNDVYGDEGWCVTYEFCWTIHVVESLDKVPQKYTIKEVVERLLSVGQLRRQGLDTQKYWLDENIKERLHSILSPEFAFNNGTLFEKLYEIGSYIHAIPRLIPKVHYINHYNEDGNLAKQIRDDYSDWNIITFDFLDDKVYKNETTQNSIYEAEHNMDDYADSYISYVQNATYSNYGGITSITEPYIGGYLSTRTDSASFEISNNDAIFKTTKPIKHLLSAKILYSNKVYDITNRIVKKNRYNTLASLTDTGNELNNKAFYLYYTEGEKNICGLTYKRDTQKLFGTSNTSIQYIIRNVLGLGEIKTCNIAIQLQYIPFENFKVKQFKEYIGDQTISSALFYNQQANDLDIEAFGEHVKGVINQTGNKNKMITKYYSHMRNIPSIHTMTTDGSAILISKEIRTYTPIKVTAQKVEEFNELNGYLTIKKNIREFEISDTQAVSRNPDYSEFCVVDIQPDVDDLTYDESHELSQNVAVGEFFMLDDFTEKLYGNNVNIKSANIHYAIIKAQSTDLGGTEHNEYFLLPVSCSAIGNSIVIHFSLEDNYSANTTTINGDNDNFRLEDYIPYTNAQGRCNLLGVAFMKGDPGTILLNSSHQLYKLTEEQANELVNGTSTVIDYYSKHPFDINKDNREQISLTMQLNFVSMNQDVWIGYSLTHTSHLIGDASTTYKYVIFKEKPSRSGSVIDPSTFVTQEEEYSVTPNVLKKMITISVEQNSCTNGVGYGIVDSNNKLVLYYDHSVEEGDKLEKFYLMFRKDI